MAITHDGMQTPLPPSRVWQLIGLLIAIGGGAVCTLGGAWWCAGISGIVFGLLAFGNQLGGVTRVRVTFSKLLVEDERPVMGFLFGPSKRRIPWEEFASVEVANGQVVAKGGETTLELGRGSSDAELQELARKIHDAAERFEKEGGAEG